MRALIAPALFVLFTLFAAEPRASAQSSPIPSQSPQQTPQKPPAGDKLLPPLPASQFPPLQIQVGSANDPAIAPQKPKAWIGALQNQKDGLAKSLQRIGGGPDAFNCAHIQIFHAPEMDSEMVVQASPGDRGPITTYQGLPPCRRDLAAPITAERFHGAPMLRIPPHKPFVLPPPSQFPTAQPLPVQPKQDTPSPKP